MLRIPNFSETAGDVDIDLGDLELAGVLSGNLLDNRREHGGRRTKEPKNRPAAVRCPRQQCRNSNRSTLPRFH